MSKLTQVLLALIVTFTVYQTNLNLSYQSCVYNAKINQLHKLEQIDKITPMFFQEKYQIAGSIRIATEQYLNDRMNCE